MAFEMYGPPVLAVFEADDALTRARRMAQDAETVPMKRFLREYFEKLRAECQEAVEEL